MLKIFKTSLVVFFLGFLLTSFSVSSQISLDLYHQLNEAKNDDQIPVLIRLNDGITIEELEGLRAVSEYGNVIRANLTPEEIRKFSSNHMAFIDAPKGKLNLLNDVMIVNNNADSVHLGLGLLDSSYDGGGIVIGIIDAPFDYSHPDFNDAEGNTRIKKLWDQAVPDDGTAPASYGYGVECDSMSIADSTCPHIDYNYWYSHGSGVAGVAASGGFTPDDYKGVAPNADLVFVSLDFGAEFLTNVVDAVEYVFNYADSVGKPCVINTSFGSYAGSHDGLDLISQSIDFMLDENPGRVVVAAAGNAGDRNIHLGYEADSNHRFTWFEKLSYTDFAYWQIWGDTADINGINFSVGADDPGTWTYKGNTSGINTLADFNLSGGEVDSLSDTLIYMGEEVGTIKWFAQMQESRYVLECYVYPADANDYWRLTSSGNGRFDLWGSEGFTGYSNMISDGLPSTAELPDINYYQLPDYEQNIVSYWQCSDKVITVGSYVNRDTMTNYYGDIPPLIDTVGQLFYSSSRGPTRDGRIKPDITSTGSRVLSTGSSVLTEWLISLGAANYMSQDGQHYLQNGTSFASPAVSGIAALYLQRYPNADSREVKDAILGNARKDSYTGEDLPDNNWGYGKADAYKALTGPWECNELNMAYAPKELQVVEIGSNYAVISWQEIPLSSSVQISWKSAGIPEVRKRSSSNPRTIGPLEPSTTYNLRIRSRCSTEFFTPWSETITFTTLPLRLGALESLTMYPNPADDFIYIEDINTTLPLVINIYSITGQLIKSNQMNDKMLSIQDIPEGTYIVEIEGEDEKIRMQLVILR